MDLLGNMIVAKRKLLISGINKIPPMHQVFLYSGLRSQEKADSCISYPKTENLGRRWVKHHGAVLGSFKSDLVG
jgi:hypothetical protein